MTVSARTWWLRLPDESKVRVAGAGVLIGRGLDCDVVLREPKASRQQALVHVTPQGPRLVAMGRSPTRVSGKEVDNVTLAAGDRIEVPGLEMKVESEGAESEQPEPAWIMRVIGGSMFGVSEIPLTLGGGPSDDVRFDDLPPAALCFRSAQNRLFVELGMEAVVGRNPRPHAAGEVLPLDPGTVLVVGGHRLQVLTSGRLHTEATLGPDAYRVAAAAREVHLQRLPKGARLHVEVGDQHYSAYLTDECRELVACLGHPPAPHLPGDLIPDGVVLGHIWPTEAKTSGDLNLLLHHLRRDLVRAGLDGDMLVKRAPGGGGTRLNVTERTVVRVS
ncbi:MAG: FHA domain-containing protein [Nannocystaceae bacterium]